MKDRPKIIVLDDDPTGSQTVHSCLLLLKWDVESLKQGLLDESPIFFILTNTRSHLPAVAEQITREVCRNLRPALDQTNTRDFLVVSRSDSTLRGHYPLETDAIAAELGPFEAHFLVPAFLEAGRITQSSIHYIEANGIRTPVHETEFARDAVFGYRSSYLPDYVAEKTQGRISANAVHRLTVENIHRGLQERLGQLENNTCVVVDALQQADLDIFAQAVLTATAQGKRFLFRSAASLLTSLAALPPQPTAAADMKQVVRYQQPGMILVGSHVQKTTQQLAHLLQQPGVVGVEVEVARLQTNPETQRRQMQSELLSQIHTILSQGKVPVIYTSRQPLSFQDAQSRLACGAAISSLLVAIVQALPDSIGFLLSKGGITSNDILSKALALTSVRLLGQILPGVSVVQTSNAHPQFPNLPVVLFPGNVGDTDAMTLAYRRLM